MTMEGPYDGEPTHAQDDCFMAGGSSRGSHAAVLCVGLCELTRTRVAALLNAEGLSCESVDSIEAARAHIVAGVTDLILVADHVLPGQFAPLAAQARRISAATKVLVVGDTPMGGALLESVRAGAIDWLDLGDSNEYLQQRIRSAVDLGTEDRRREDRIARLKGICRKLSITRNEFSRQIDSLSEGLSDVAERVGEAKTVGEFSGLISQELDVEELLRTSMQYMLTKTGATNAAVFLPGSKSDQFGLGAYVTYKCKRHQAEPLLSRLASDICPRVAASDDIIRFADTAEFIESIGIEAEVLADCELVAWSARHGDECMGVFFLFRSRNEPFKDELAGLIDALRPVFAEQMARIVRVHHRSRFLWPESRADINDIDEDTEGEDWRRAA